MTEPNDWLESCSSSRCHSSRQLMTMLSPHRKPRWLAKESDRRTRRFKLSNLTDAVIAYEARPWFNQRDSIKLDRPFKKDSTCVSSSKLVRKIKSRSKANGKRWKICFVVSSRFCAREVLKAEWHHLKHKQLQGTLLPCPLKVSRHHGRANE